MQNFTLVKAWVNLEDFNRYKCKNTRTMPVGWTDMIIPTIQPSIPSTPPKTWITRILEKEELWACDITQLLAFICMLTYIWSWSIALNQFKHMSMHDTVMQVLAKMKITFVGSIITKSQVEITNFMLNTWNQQWNQQWLEKGKISTWRVQVHKSLEKRKKMYHERLIIKTEETKERWRESLEVVLAWKIP